MPSELGRFIRKKRLEAGIGLREFARQIEKSAPFLSQLESDDDPPPASPDTLLAIARELREDPDQLFALAKRLPSELVPGSVLEVALYRKVKELPPDEQQRELKRYQRKSKKRGSG
jgi:transcriptional regulator with XRE-family HTH domain